LVSFAHEGIEEKMNELLNTKKALLSQLAALNVASNAKPNVAVQAQDPHVKDMFDQEKDVLQSLSKAGEVIVLSAKDEIPVGCLKGFVTENISIYVKVVGLIDIKLEVTRINKRVKQLEDLSSKLKEKIDAPTYKDKVPEKVRAENDAKLAGYQTELGETIKQLKLLETLGN
jgi:valyl-tRNA synthetase